MWPVTLPTRNGTHRVCTDAVLAAIDIEKEAGAEWLKDCRIWMYRGAWAEWEIETLKWPYRSVRKNCVLNVTPS